MMTAITNMPISNFNESRKRVLLLLCMFVFPIVFTSILFGVSTYVGDIDLKVITHKTAFAHIKSPKNRTVVNKKFEITGSLAAPKPDHSYYLVEYRNKMYWPKFDLGNKPIKWRKSLTHRANKDQFAAYQVIMADALLSATFDNWFKTSRETGKYPGMVNLTFDNIVANIKVKTQ